MTRASPALTIDELEHGDHIEVTFDAPLEDPTLPGITRARGPVTLIIGQVYLAAEDHRSAFQMPTMLRIDHLEGVTIVSHRRGDDIARERADRRRGDRLYTGAPKTASELRDRLETLAEMIASDDTAASRREELRFQFGDEADRVALAKSKRTYLLVRPRVGEDFHPWTTRHPVVIRIDTVRPIPSDFELDPSARKDRTSRLEETVRIFGEAERDTRKMLSQLRAAGYECRRPHPQAQEILVRFTLGEGRRPDRFDMSVSLSGNGLWEVHPVAPQNKREARARARLLRTDRPGALAREVEALQIFE